MLVPSSIPLLGHFGAFSAILLQNQVSSLHMLEQLSGRLKQARTKDISQGSVATQ